MKYDAFSVHIFIKERTFVTSVCVSLLWSLISVHDGLLTPESFVIATWALCLEPIIRHYNLLSWTASEYYFQSMFYTVTVKVSKKNYVLISCFLIWATCLECRNALGITTLETAVKWNNTQIARTGFTISLFVHSSCEHLFFLCSLFVPWMGTGHVVKSVHTQNNTWQNKLENVRIAH